MGLELIFANKEITAPCVSASGLNAYATGQRTSAYRSSSPLFLSFENSLMENLG
jgi:hypothetical protein